MRVTIHQPEHMPWLGFFHKINMADVYVVLDNVQFRKRYFQNRNKIRTANGVNWLTVPVKVKDEFSQKIKDTLIDDSNRRWNKKYWDSVFFSYKKAPFFRKYSDKISSILSREWTHIVELNMSLIAAFLEILELKPEIIKASDIKGLDDKKSSLILKICQRLDAKIYISGISGREYLDTQEFKESGIRIIFQEFHHPIYHQLYKPFIPCMSVIDLLFNYGDKSLSVINGVDVAVMKKVFI